ncbi:MAG: CDP-alcohol phosphatidyltransferase family protein [Candidatus Thorarchaeota archaeon]
MMPVGKAIARTGITPNMITGLTVLVALVSAWFFAIGDLLVGLLFMIITVVMDMFDGAVARAAGLASKFGATFDHTLDRSHDGPNKCSHHSLVALCCRRYFHPVVLGLLYTLWNDYG